MAAREAAEAMGRGLRQSVSASGGHVPVKAARELHDRLMAPGDVRPSDVVDVVHALARLIEVEELRYERLVGDSGGSHRAGYAIGRILSLVQDDVSGVDVVSKYCLDALTSPSTPPKAQAAGLRLLCAVVSVTGFQFPLTDERLVDRLRAWALGDLRPHADAAPRTARREAADAAEAAERAAAEAEASGAPTAHLARRAATLAKLEALRVKTYALGCLAVALEAEDVASELVRDGVMSEIVTPLRLALVEKAPNEGADVVEAFINDPDSERASPRSLGVGGERVERTVNRDDRDVDFGRSAIAEDEEHVVASHEQMATETGDRDAAAKSLAEALTSRAPADAPSLPARLLEARLRALAATGEYIECFGQALRCGAVEVALALVRGSYWNEDNPAWPREAAERRLRSVHAADAAVSESLAARRFVPCAPQLPESLAAVCSLLAHRKFAVTFVDRGGVAALLSIPKGALSVDGFHRCLFALSQSPSAMERLLAPGRDAATFAAARRCVDVALEALDGGHETARRHAALFLALSFPFPAVVDAFDAAGGLRPLLNLLRHAAQLSAAATAAAKQTACHACHALRQYARAHLHRRVSRNAPDPGYRAVDLGQAATDRNLRAASRDPETAASMQKASWLPVDAFVAQGGHEIVLALMHVAAGDRHFHECVPAGLAALRIATLHPSARNATVVASVGAPASLSAADVLLEIAARAAGAQDAEAAVDALQIVRQLVAPPPALASAASAASAPPPRRLQRERSRVSTTPSKKLAHRRGSTAAGQKKDTESVGEEKESAFDRAFRPGRAALREAGGLRALLAMLTRGARRLPPPNDDAARALCCDALIACARDPAIAQTLQTLQVARRLTEMVSSHKHKRGLGAAGAGSEARDPLAGKNPGRYRRGGGGGGWRRVSQGRRGAHRHHRRRCRSRERGARGGERRRRGTSAPHGAPRHRGGDARAVPARGSSSADSRAPLERGSLEIRGRARRGGGGETRNAVPRSSVYRRRSRRVDAGVSGETVSPRLSAVAPLRRRLSVSRAASLRDETRENQSAPWLARQAARHRRRGRLRRDGHASPRRVHARDARAAARGGARKKNARNARVEKHARVSAPVETQGERPRKNTERNRGCACRARRLTGTAARRDRRGNAFTGQIARHSRAFLAARG
jgi:HIV-1 Vpr-binding protein